MTPLRLTDGLVRHRGLRVLWACVVTVLALAVALHHAGPLGDMAMPVPGAPAMPPGAAAPAMTSHAGHHMAAAPSAAAETSRTPGGAPRSPAKPGHGHDHAMTMAMCLAILASALLVPAIRWVRRQVARLRTGLHRRPRILQRPPSALLPSTWAPPPRGGPSRQSLLCVVLR